MKMDFKNLIIKELNTPQAEFYLINEFNRIQKDRELSKTIRNTGNELFMQCKHNAKMHKRILDCYLCSIALAPNESDFLASSYANLSVLLFHLYKYEDCIKTINKALEINKSVSLKIKLLYRKVKCCAALNLSKEIETIIEIFKNCLQTVDKKSDDHNQLLILIDKTKNVLEEKKTKTNKCNNPNIQTSTNQINKKLMKLKKFKTKHLETLIQKESEDIFKSVEIIHSVEYGKQLIANRDIKPGEIIFVTKPYVLAPNFQKCQTVCSNCLKILWFAIPCNNCPYSMYCSKECQFQALQNYHNVECIILQFILLGNNQIDYPVQSSVRTIIKALKEFETIENLKQNVSNIDKSADSKDNKFCSSSVTSLFGFKNVYLEPAILNDLVKSCCRAVIGLAKFTSFFGNDYKFNDTKSLVDNEDIVFIGSLLLRIAIIVYNNGSKVIDQDPCQNFPNQTICTSNVSCCERGFSLNTMSHLIPHSCSPNVKSLKTEGSREFWYAVQPIYKGDQLLECYGSTFFELDLFNRSESIAHILHRNCKCVACIENWPSFLIENNQAISFDNIFTTVIESIEHDNEKQAFLNVITQCGLHHQMTIEKLSKIMDASFNYFGQPSLEVCCAIYMLHCAFNGLYEMKSNMPDKCRTVEK